MHLLPTLPWEDTTSEYSFTLVDEQAVPIDGSGITAMTLTYYALNLLSRTRTIINSRQDQDVLNANNVTLEVQPNPPQLWIVYWLLQPADLVTMVLAPGETWELHEAHWTWSWDGGNRIGAHRVAFGVQAA